MHEVEYIGGKPRPEGDLGPVKVWAALGLLAVILVIFMQWFRGDLASTTMKAAPESVAKSEDVEGGQYSDFAMTAKSIVRLSSPVRDEEETAALAQVFQEEMIPLAVTRTERLRLGILGGELVGKEEAVAHLTKLKSELDADSELGADATWLLMLYQKGAGALSQEVRDSLIERHGWFGELALAHGLPAHDSFRRQVTGGRARILSIFTFINRAEIVLFLLGAAIMVAIGVNYDALTVRGQFDDAVPDENLHAFVLFCIGFVIIIGLSLLPFGLQAEGSMTAAVIFELLPWALLAIPAWPLIRKVPWAEFRRTVGLHAGRGVIVEAAIGVAAYIAWMPATIGLSQALEWMSGWFGSSNVEDTPSGHPMFQSPPSDSGLLLFLSIFATVAWAPLVEEIIFRGFLQGWVRERLGPALAVFITSIAFGIVHPYSPLGIIQVTAAGFMFCMLREMRGSLIAPMVAHALHNGLITWMSLSIARAIGG